MRLPYSSRLSAGAGLKPAPSSTFLQLSSCTAAVGRPKRHDINTECSSSCLTLSHVSSSNSISFSNVMSQRRDVTASAAAIADPPAALNPAASGHTALLHGLGDVGDIPAAYMPWVLRIAAACSHTSGGDSQAAMADISRGISTWRASLNRGLLPDDEAIQQLQRNNEPFTRGTTCQG
jgi:hypothetical protein